MTLEASERRSLEAACRTLLPRLDGPGEARAHFTLGADDLGVAPAFEKAMESLGVRQRSELRLLLRLMDSAPFMFIASRRYSRFAGLGADERERALLAMAEHPLPGIRSGFQALKRLAAFLFYSLAPERGNPLLADIGYAIPAPRPARTSLRLTRITKDTTLLADVCVIGSGAGGSVAAARLAAAGKRVVVLEAGAGDQAPDFDHHEIVGMQRLYLDRGTTATRDLGVAILAGSSVGGGTTVNWQTSLRTPDFIRDEWAERSGIRDFADTPFTRSLDAVCERLGVGIGESRRNANNAALERGCKALGYAWSVIPRNARGCDDSQCGFCVFGCRVGGKQSAGLTWLVDAQATGNTEIVASCRAQGLQVERGRVTGVRAIARDDATGITHNVRVKAGLVVAAAGALETPALLMRTGIAHQELGRNLFLHPTSAVGGVYDQPIEGWLGAPQTVLCDEFARLRGNFGVRLETPPIHPGLFGLAIPWTGAREHRERMQQLAHFSAFIVLTRDKRGGTVGVDPEGRAVIRYSPDGMQRELLRRGIAEAARVHWAAGAREIHTLHTRPLQLMRDSGHDIDAFCAAIERRAVHGNRSQLFSAHQMGTCRMGAKKTWGVCDERGAVRDVRGLYVADASLFPASSGVNPMISVMAIAHMLADRLR